MRCCLINLFVADLLRIVTSSSAVAIEDYVGLPNIFNKTVVT